ncbi:MAG: sigma 54-interacting transcriptional regulator [Firmicutes bacterium]|nr:sigma 54-interacting transcriptional regulator [Bacillota bacterium]
MNSKIVMVTPEPLPPFMETEIRKHIDIIYAVMEEVIPWLDVIKKSKVKAVISRGGTADIIRSHLDIPVVNVEITTFDVLRAIFENRNKLLPHEKEIGLVSYYKSGYDIPSMERILGLKIHNFSYQTTTDLHNNVLKAKQLGLRTIFGGKITHDECKKHGLQGILLSIAQDTFIQSLQRSHDIINIRKHDSELNERLKAILNLTQEGIISTDSAGKINLINPTAERLLGLDRTVIGQHINEALPKELINILNSSVGVSRQIVSTPRGQIVVKSTPISVEEDVVGTVATFNDVTEVQMLEYKIRKELFAKGLVAQYSFDDIIGLSEPLLRVISEARHYSPSDATVLITGESGTGKELFAHSIHRASHRQEGPFVAINCAALPENLLESELFGYEEGAFTGARKGGKPGLFELAHNGTLFLDEIGEMPYQLQARLLRALQNKVVRRIGGERLIPVNVRIVAATNSDLLELVKQGLFRKDLYFRLDVLRLKIPPLRNRLSDIPYLLDHFIKKISAKYNKRVPGLSKTLTRHLMLYNWPGNVRELENFVEKYVLLYDPGQDPEELNQRLLALLGLEDREVKRPAVTIRVGNLEEMERNIVAKLDEIYQDKQELADLLGISRTTLWRKLQYKKGRKMANRNKR